MSLRNQDPSPKIKTLINGALRKLPKGASAVEKDLLRVLGSRISEEDLEVFTAANLAEMAHSHWELSRERDEKGAKIRIYCPLTGNKALRKTMIDIVSDDRAFLVDSIAAEINNKSLLIDFLFHPTIYVDYKKEGTLAALKNEHTPELLRQSHIHIHIKEVLSPQDLQKLEDGLWQVLEDVYYANKDWRKMLSGLKEARNELSITNSKTSLRDIEQYCAFLDYLYDNNFTFLGAREYEFYEQGGVLKSRTVKDSSLGLLSNELRPAYINETEECLPHHFQEMRRNLPAIYISKTNRMSTVHRSVPMDAIAIKTYDTNGNIKGERLFLGLFTSVTYSRSVSDVPYLREKVEEVMHMSGFIPGSHNRKALRHILEKYPRDELFQIHPRDLYKIALNILRLQERQRISLFMRADPFGRYISCLVYIPRDRFSSSLRRKISEILSRELEGTPANFFTTMDDSVFARVMFIITIKQHNLPRLNQAKLERLLQEAGQTWSERLSETLLTSMENQREALQLTLKYGEAFPVSYTTQYRARQSVFDIVKIEQVLDTGTMTLDLYRPEGMKENELRLKIYNPDAPVTLSDVMPILENMGLRAIAELPFEINPKEAGRSIWIHDFQLQNPNMDRAVDIETVKKNFERAVWKTWYREIENDGLNHLVLTANMNWHEILILRSYVRYLRQIRFPFGRHYVEKALNQHPKISRILVDLFKAYHNPDLRNKRDALIKELKKTVGSELEKVESLDEDRILRAVANLITNTVRTNYYQRQADGTGKPYLALKFNSRKIEEIPAPKPFMEIFVYSTRVEAVHLRGDKIARGGLRWSDRREDYRTEVLGLMKAQMVKNAIIVPMGAKGGFVVKSDIQDREEFHKEGVECYKIFIRGLMDITDNLEGEKIIPPENVVRHDGDDPYLVVAADKGTASFSDIANGISKEYGFWLGDAFASGGSAGYDHKKMGITARGAWESVKMHFRELGHNTQKEPFDVAGIGDMAGDVFGNGMLLSNQIRLIGAFNHLHIFCDPDPDPKKSFKERRRLFDEAKGWDSYDKKILSKGGQIYSRRDKILKLTPEIQQRFDLDKSEMTPPELMQAILKSRVDLLWFGGIGTYIKSTRESDADVGDKANDSIRINAKAVRAKVIAEGANLGVTQLGRIEFAEKGGKINTDSIDNSAGVDSSDHEVNIKILMTEIMKNTKHKMGLAARNALLKEMTDDVAALVLQNNYRQAQAVSFATFQAPENLQDQEDFIQDLERNYGLDRKIEGLPDEEVIESRLRGGYGLTRPELCVLMSYAKNNFTRDLLASDIPDAPEMQKWLIHYFPEALQKKYAPEILKHRLSREIIATCLSNSLINRMGPTFIKSSMEKSGRSCADVARAYVIVRDSFGLRSLWDQIEALDNKVPSDIQMSVLMEISELTKHAINWFLNRFSEDLDIGREIENFGTHIRTLRSNMDDIITEGVKKDAAARAAVHRRNGLPASLAQEISLIPVLSSSCDIINIASTQKTNLLHMAQTYFQIGEKFHLVWLREKALHLRSDDSWQSKASRGMIDQLYKCQAGITVQVLRDVQIKNGTGKSLVNKWLQAHEEQVARLDPFFTELHRAGSVDLAHLVIAEQRLRKLYGG